MAADVALAGRVTDAKSGSAAGWNVAGGADGDGVVEMVEVAAAAAADCIAGQSAANGKNPVVAAPDSAVVVDGDGDGDGGESDGLHGDVGEAGHCSTAAAAAAADESEREAKLLDLAWWSKWTQAADSEFQLRRAEQRKEARLDKDRRAEPIGDALNHHQQQLFNAWKRRPDRSAGMQITTSSCFRRRTQTCLLSGMVMRNRRWTSCIIFA